MYGAVLAQIFNVATKGLNMQTANATQTAPRPGAAPEAPAPAMPDKGLPKGNKRDEHIHVQKFDLILSGGWTIDLLLANPLKAMANIDDVRSMAEMRVFDQQITEYARILIRNAVASRGTGVTHLELVVLDRHKLAEKFEKPVQNVWHYDFDAVNGHHVVTPAGIVRFANLPTRERAEQMVHEQKANQPRRHGTF